MNYGLDVKERLSEMKIVKEILDLVVVIVVILEFFC